MGITTVITTLVKYNTNYPHLFLEQPGEKGEDTECT